MLLDMRRIRVAPIRLGVFVMDYCAICGVSAVARCQGSCGGRPICRNHIFPYDPYADWPKRSQEAYSDAASFVPRSGAVCSDCRHKIGCEAVEQLSSRPELPSEPGRRLAMLMLERTSYTDDEIAAAMNDVGGLSAGLAVVFDQVVKSVAVQHRTVPRLVTYGQMGRGITIQDSTPNSDASDYRPTQHPSSYTLIGQDGHIWDYGERWEQKFLGRKVTQHVRRLRPADFDYWTNSLLEKVPLVVWKQILA
jgi:hypothetical protein